MTREEKIKEEWVAIYGEEKYNFIKYAIKENGYIDCVRNPEISKIISTTQKGICWGTTDYMPCNLKGVHNNNGWIKIESEADLPKESDFFWIYEEAVINEPCYFNSVTKKWIIECEQYPTHYKQIIKPDYPLF